MPGLRPHNRTVRSPSLTVGSRRPRRFPNRDTEISCPTLVARAATPALLLAAIVASVVALVATTLSTPAVAATHASRVGVTHSKHARRSTGRRAVRAKHALARAKKALAPATPAAERPDATLALRNLFLLKDALVAGRPGGGRQALPAAQQARRDR